MMAPTPSTRRTAIVTGGTRGIGLGISRSLASRGWRLALCGMRSGDEIREVLDELTASGAEAAYWQADIAQSDDRARLVDGAFDRFGIVDALVNNAGRAPRVRADLLDATEESFDEVMRTNLQGPYFLTQAFSKRLVAANRPGRVVFVTSVSAKLASTNRGEYCVSKAGLAMAVQLFALRLAPAGIPVYEVRPGVIATDMTAGVKELYDRRIADGLVPEGRWGQPDDVGRVVAALLNGDLPYATGSVIHVDGGLAIPRL